MSRRARRSGPPAPSILADFRPPSLASARHPAVPVRNQHQHSAIGALTRVWAIYGAIPREYRLPTTASLLQTPGSGRNYYGPGGELSGHHLERAAACARPRDPRHLPGRDRREGRVLGRLPQLRMRAPGPRRLGGGTRAPDRRQSIRGLRRHAAATPAAPGRAAKVLAPRRRRRHIRSGRSGPKARPALAGVGGPGTAAANRGPLAAAVLVFTCVARPGHRLWGARFPAGGIAGIVVPWQ
jgi:hypothetical protein